ncbi:MAG: hypothetical protein OZ921_04135 [Sorangiineae bacterium]|nr:hypothetical protein [Polyangiaceae bacterium]MEB2321678.1 hypothetical protein [Sorangiineae bacterium]
MFVPRLVTRIALGGAFALAPLTLAACGGGQKVVHAAVQPGTMPDGGDWTGVYYSELYGYLHLIKEGDTVTGCWRNTAGDEFGQMSGKVEGNLLRYSWQNQKIGQVGAAAQKAGKGYFKYGRPKAGEADVIDGQWGTGESDAGDTWTAVKQERQVPDCKKVIPDRYDRGNVGGGWDDATPNQEEQSPSGDSEAPNP